MNHILRGLCFVIFTIHSLTFGEGLRKQNEVNVSVRTVVRLSADTGLYTYSYELTNFAGAALEVSEFYIPLRGSIIINASSPEGWKTRTNTQGTLVTWCACSENGFIPPEGYVDDGRGLPSKYQVKPGQTLAGFSMQSAFPPSAGNFYAGGWLPIPVEGTDFPIGQEPVAPDFPGNMFQGTVSAAPTYFSTLDFGGRRPSVDGFLVFTSLKDGGAYASPLAIDIAFSQQGEIVQQNTFKATLNGTDITNQFIAISPKQMRAVLTTGAVLKAGKNVLQTVVQGTVPGATRQARDTDRLTFLIQ